jgi:hypothetical protein
MGRRRCTTSCSTGGWLSSAPTTWPSGPSRVSSRSPHSCDGNPKRSCSPQDALVRLPTPRGGNRPPSRRIRHLPAPVATFNGSIRAFAPPRVAATWHRGRLRRLPPSRRSPPPRCRSRRTSPGRGRSGGGPRPSTCLRRDRSSCTQRSSGPAGTGDERQPAAPGKWGQRGATLSARYFMRPEATQRPGRNRRAPA